MKELMDMMKLGEKINPKEKDSKMEILMELKQLMTKLIADDMGESEPEIDAHCMEDSEKNEHPVNELQKVTVAAPNQKGLEQGLNQVKGLINDKSSQKSVSDMLLEDEEEDELV